MVTSMETKIKRFMVTSMETKIHGYKHGNQDQMINGYKHGNQDTYDVQWKNQINDGINGDRAYTSVNARACTN